MNDILKNALFLTGGVAVGVITGILTAPKSGKETRADIEHELDNLKTKIGDFAGESSKSVQKKIAELKKSISEIEVQMSN